MNLIKVLVGTTALITGLGQKTTTRWNRVHLIKFGLFKPQRSILYQPMASPWAIMDQTVGLPTLNGCFKMVYSYLS
jgi:hypothetical protein